MNDETMTHPVHQALTRITRFASDAEREAIDNVMQRAKLSIKAALDAQEDRQTPLASESRAGPFRRQFGRRC